MNANVLQQREKVAQLIWTGIILTFFVIQAIIWIVAISITANDSSHVVVVGYDEQALNWDAVKQLRQASVRLGWQAEIHVDQTADIRHNRVISIELSDRSNLPLQNARFALIAFHRGHAANVQELEFKEIEQGIYTGRITVQRFGTWCFSGRVQVGDDVYLIQETLRIGKPRVADQ